MIEQQYIDIINITLKDSITFNKYSVNKFSSSDTFVYATLRFDYNTITSINSFSPYDFLALHKGHQTFSVYYYNLFVDRFNSDNSRLPTRNRSSTYCRSRKYYT